MPLSDIAKKPHPPNFTLILFIFAKPSIFDVSHCLDPALGQSEDTLFRPVTDARRSTMNPMRAPLPFLR